MYGGSRQYLPLRVNQAGVMPIIFASSLLMFPYMLFQGFGQAYGGIWVNLAEAFHRGTSYFYNVLYVLLIYFFCYFLDGHQLQSQRHGRQPEETSARSFPAIAPASGRPTTWKK